MAKQAQNATESMIVPTIALGRLDHIGDLHFSGRTVPRTLHRKRIVGFGEFRGSQVVVKIANPSVVGASESVSAEIHAREAWGDIPGLVALRATGTVQLDPGQARPKLSLPYLAEARAPYVLAELLHDSGVTRQRCIAIWTDVVSACSRLHLLGYSHGDIKPDNILCGSNGQDVALFDFGSMKRLDFTDALPFCAPGYFAAPELLQSVRSDVFSLGVLLHTLLSDAQFPLWRWGGPILMRDLPDRTCLEWATSSGPSYAPLITSMTQVDPQKRPPLAQVISTAERLAL